jgi:N-acetylglucosaminyldiphosphoundecaprenol N-acetyl-beta-D-mannosaminyltransferase
MSDLAPGATSLLEMPDVVELPAPTPTAIEVPEHSILGVRVADLTMADAIELLHGLIRTPREQAATLFFVNAHTLNLAYEDPSYRRVLNRATYVFGDGTGVRWASRLQGVRLKANLNGTDLVPELFHATAGQGYRYYLLGSTAESIRRAAHDVQRRFPGWELAGFHDGYLDAERTARVIDEINQVEPHLLLVGMGNPLQERWIDRHRDQLRVHLCMGTGGLFSYWAGDIRRAPAWIRRLGYEWLRILLQQPHKWRRYVLGNPAYLLRVVKERWTGPLGVTR